MKLFRDRDGNVYQIPEHELARFLVEQELPVGSELSAEELGQARGGASTGASPVDPEPSDGPGHY